MKKTFATASFALLFWVAIPAAAEGLPASGAAATAADEGAAERDEAYRQGRRALDDERWDEAVRQFAAVAARDGQDADAALYWKAYAEHKAGEPAAAMESLAELEASHPESRWRDDARALRVEIGGDDPGSVGEDDELKLLALNSLMHVGSERAVELLERFLDGGQPEKLRDRALFVLSQNRSRRARELLADTARGGRGRELQLAAIRYLGMTGGEFSDLLEEIYASTEDVETKKHVLRAFMVSSDADKVLAVYRGERDPELRLAAVRQLGVMGARGKLRELYGAETSAEVKEQLLKALFISGDAGALIDIYRGESDPELRRAIVKNVGLTGKEEARAFLVEVYRRESDREVKKTALNGLFLARGATELIEIAREETDPELRKAAIRFLGMTGSEKAVDFLMEILEEP